MDQRRNAAERLLASYSRFYGITRFDGMDAPETKGVREALKLSVPLLPGGAELTAVCEYYERNGGYFLLRSNELWTSEQEEFIFLFTCPRLTEAVHEAVKEFVCREGKKMAHIGPGHMYTGVSSVIICDDADEAAEKALKKSSYTKTFRFMIHGWLEYRANCLDLSRERFLFNRAGRRMQPEMMKVWEGRKAGLA